MKKFLIAIPMIAGLAACDGTTSNQGALTGAALGAATGAAVSGGDDKVQGAIIGGLAGAAAGTTSARPSPANACTRTPTASATSRLAR